MQVNTKKILINSITSTKKLAKIIASQLKPGTHIFLSGPVGAGKSTLVKFILSELGVEYRGSPTFGLMHTYETLKSQVIHMDLYNQSKNIFKEMYEFQDEIFLIEWPEKNPNLFSIFRNPLQIHLKNDEKIRSAALSVELDDDWYVR